MQRPLCKWSVTSLTLTIVLGATLYGNPGLRTLPAQEGKGSQIRKGRLQGQILPSVHHLRRPAQMLHTVKKEPMKATEIRLFALFQKTRASQHCIMCCIISIKLRWFPLMPGRNFIKAIELLLLEGYSQWVVLYFILFNGKNDYHRHSCDFIDACSALSLVLECHSVKGAVIKLVVILRLKIKY